ncbi:hypothetical protein [Actinosynnema sp. NPDC023587]|uniref:hypothetical protein n=1 Tax=Actinosynnema sp. NPDC023587 TaxID=3154695 RepID=UPI0033CCD6AE
MTVAWLWLRAHRWPVLLGTCAGVAAVAATVGGEHVPVPSFGDVRRLDVPLTQLLPLVLAGAVGLHSRTPTTLFLVAPRRAGPLRAALVGCLVGTASLTSLVFAQPVTALRNTLGLVGLALVTAVVAGATRSWTLPLVHLVACLLFGTRLSATAQGGRGEWWWAFPLADADDRSAFALAVACCAVGVVAFVARGPRPEIVAD